MTRKETRFTPARAAATLPGRRRFLVSLTGAGLAVLGLTVLGQPAQARAARLERPGEVALGAPNAPVEIVEYFSLSCPHCAAFHRQVFADLEASYIETGKVRFVFRDFPLTWAAVQAAILAHCAGPERYFDLLDALFASARDWQRAEKPLPAIADVGEAHGVERARFWAYLQEDALERRVLESYKTGNEEFGVTSTPTFFINGEKHVGGIPFDELSELIDVLIPPRR